MKITDLGRIFNQILDNTEATIQSGSRNLILNEQYFHHQFSHYVAKHYEQQGRDVWRESILVPEHPTLVKYTWKEFGLGRPKTTQRLALNRGQAGRFDFVIRDTVPAFIEWKGPRMYDERDIAQDLTKLLMVKSQRSPKVFAAIITSSTRSDANHQKELTARFYAALKFVRHILDIDTVQELKKHNLYAFIATVPDDGARKFIWGKV